MPAALGRGAYAAIHIRAAWQPQAGRSSLERARLEQEGGQQFRDG